MENTTTTATTKGKKSQAKAKPCPRVMPSREGRKKRQHQARFPDLRPPRTPRTFFSKYVSTICF
ncbi:hypothetical protein V8C44DRAFT_321314 [Trichoderma aethiopicum]